MNSVDAAWVAGIIEGEGTIHIVKTEGKPRIAVGMTDEDVVRALHQKTGVGYVYGPYDKDNWGNKEFYQWIVQKREDVRSIINEILPFLYSRRTLQALVCLDAMDELDRKAEFRKKFCKLGHNREEVGTNSRGDCLPCVEIWNSNRRQRYHEKVS